MFNHDLWVQTLGLIVVGAPALLVAAIGLPALIDRPLGERAIGRWAYGTIVVSLLSSLVILGIMLAFGTRSEAIELGHWVSIPEYEFSVKFVFDRLSVPFAILSFVLCGTIGAFAARYMHRERGFNRFFVLYSFFVLGMTMTSLSGTVETLFAGWELVGLSSALLVAFYHERPAPCRNGLRVWIVYRFSDAALLVASILLHHLRGHGDFSLFLGDAPWPEGHCTIDPRYAFGIGLLLLIAAAGKSALVPFSGWLPRAMEGPTPSSAVFYGALSVHLGAFLLLRFSPLLELSPWMGVVVIALGGLTSAFATMAQRVQTDIKSALSFASLAQVGIIVVEIGIGLYPPLTFSFFGAEWSINFRYIALFHILGHGCLRTLQFVRAPTILHDYRILENAIGSHLSHGKPLGGVKTAPTAWTRFYRVAMERGYLDAFLMDYVARPFLAVLRMCDRAERRWTDFLAGTTPEPTETNKPAARAVTLADDAG
jgi:NAD(P)H-quinone oxidoreductase subunit 5